VGEERTKNEKRKKKREWGVGNGEWGKKERRTKKEEGVGSRE
jgi:hypothetical protein